MRPIEVTLAAAGFTKWLPVDFRLVPANITLDVNLNASANLTYSVDYTDSDIFQVFQPPRSLSRVATAATMEFYDEHDLVIDDWIGVRNAGAPFDTELGVVASVPDAFTITYTVLNTGPLTPPQPTIVEVRKANVRVHGGLANKTVTDVSGLVLPTRAVRLRNSLYVAGRAKLTVIQSGW